MKNLLVSRKRVLDLNEIERKFYDALVEVADDESFINDIALWHNIEPQVVIGIYVVDFVVSERFVIEIDGHEWHKTKEQREADYKRERYLFRNGYSVIRFTGTEVYLSCQECALEAIKMVDDAMLEADRLMAENCKHYHENMMIKERGKLNGTTI